MSKTSLQQACYHCGEPIPQGGQLVAHLGGKTRPVCSERCQAAAEWIGSMGLADYYQLRQNSASAAPVIEDYAGWNNPDLLAQVLKQKSDGLWQVNLLIDGMHCAGCVWLIERLFIKLGGVSDVQINPITHRAMLTFDTQRISLKEILHALNKAGYQPRPLEASQLDESRKNEHRDLLKRLLVAGFGMMQVMTYAFVLYMGNFELLPAETSELFRWLGFLVATPVVFYSAAPFYQGARYALQGRSLNMDVPIAIAITAVYGSSVYQAIMSQGEVYFESVSMLVFFLLTGRYLEMRARHRSVDNADALIRLTPAFAERRLPDGTLETVPVVSLRANDIIHVDEGAYIPVDGVLLSESCLLDEALLSGEASARKRLRDEAVIAGSMVLEGPIEVSVNKVGSETFLASLANLSVDAQTQRPRLSQRGEKATVHFVWRVLVIASVTLLAWLWYDKSQALEATIALLVVACPCALGLAAPAAITRALGVLAQRNVLVIKPDALENILKVDTVVFDKTGTLTEPSVLTEQSDSELLQLAASLARESQHPLSRALVEANRQPLLVVKNTQTFLGLGLEGTVNGRVLRLGQARFALQDEVLAQEYADASLILAEQGQFLASFVVDEAIRDDALPTLNFLQEANIHCIVVSGDSTPRVMAITQKLGLSDYYARQLPVDKLQLLKDLQAQKHCVMMVGDGSNDAPVLAGADVSIALSSGTELAQANADILLCDGRLSRLVDIHILAKKTQKILIQNERWAMAYNTTAMPFAALGFIPPWLAAIFMSLSSLFVVLNALRIGR